MGFSTLVTNAVATAKTLTKDLQTEITLEKFIGDEKEYEKTAGRRMYSEPVKYKVILNNRTKFVGLESGGASTVQVSSIQFLDPVMVTVRDKITLPDGSCPQLAAVEGNVDANGLYYAPLVLFSWLR